MMPGFDTSRQIALSREQKKAYAEDNTTNRDARRCPNRHPLWKLYYKRVGQETIICCKDCDA